MNATKILWGQVLLVSLVVLAFVWTATEWTAWRLGFQPQLGHPWFELLGWPVYQPATRASSSGAGVQNTSATTGRNTCCVSRRHGAARAWVWSFQLF